MSDTPVLGDVYKAGKSVVSTAVNTVTGGLLSQPDGPSPTAPTPPPTPVPTPSADGTKSGARTETQQDLQDAEDQQRRARSRASTILSQGLDDGSGATSVSRRTLAGI